MTAVAAGEVHNVAASPARGVGMTAVAAGEVYNVAASPARGG
jgi:hypothetical protein